MKVLLSVFGCDPTGGSEAAIGWNWALELARSGHEVWAFTSTRGEAGIGAYLRAQPISNLRFKFVPLPKVAPIWGPVSYIVEARRWQRSILPIAEALEQEIGFDIVHHVSYGSMHIGSELWRLGKPFVLGPVGGGQTAPWGFSRYLRGGALLEGVRTAVVSQLTGWFGSARRSASNASIGLYANEETGRWLTRLGCPRQAFMPAAGISSDWLSQGLDRRATPEPLRILWIGRLLPRKAILLSLEALAAVDPALSWTCTIIGDGPQGRFVERWIRDLGLEGRVTWRGKVPWAEVRTACLTHDVTLFSSLRDTDGNQILEAMAGGCAVVTLRHQGAACIVTDRSGIRVEVSRPERVVTELARALETLAREADRLAAMRIAAIDEASRHTWASKAERAGRYYREIANGQPFASTLRYAEAPAVRSPRPQ